MRGLAKAPRQIWDVLFDARVRANLTLCHAACNVLRRNGWPELTGSASATGFFIEGIDDENAVYEATVQALARVKNGEKSLRIVAALWLLRNLREIVRDPTGSPVLMYSYTTAKMISSCRSVNTASHLLPVISTQAKGVLTHLLRMRE